MNIPNSSSIQRQQTKRQFANTQEYLNYELGNAVRRLPPLYTRVLVSGICLAVTGTIAWAAFSKVEEVATANGQVVPATQVQPLRSLAAGQLRDINITEGKAVKKGDVLVQLDPTQSKVEVQRLEKLVTQNRGALARLEAERSGKVQAGSVLQNELLAARLREYRDRRFAAEAEASRQLSAIRAAQVQKTRLQSDLVFATQKSQAMQALAVRGAVPRFDYIDTQNKVEGLQKEIAIQDQAIEQSRQAFQAAKTNARRLEAERQSEILTQIDKQQQELTDLEGKLSQASEQQKQSSIRAGVDGTVYNVKVAKTGATVHAGDELLSIVPAGEELLVEAKVSNQDVGFIKPGMRVKVKLASFPYQEYGMVEGTVSKISPNAVNEKDMGLVFPVQVQLKQHFVRVNGQEVSLTPGMVATAEIVTRQKTVLSFLLDPITGSWDRAFSVR
ncbi:MAG TPA: HlyD family type I secretion periplasmic adaptor subunit [Leptolyngbyaceae cyanobacterium M33_DOE_097]|uniref:HlyD family type I secretion periplasmic adaptor subunit n=1 Tax=Oscillatoriales cyanobacterium SpSt-418 TaxID=2282169 RepID=A0A7C3KL23_9CYAN|nr:HlyD family type I secretion periplasmic adaptor subunit [Leptolyngbyaceae cyanobacterium M33_DOE_097]